MIFLIVFLFFITGFAETIKGGKYEIVSSKIRVIDSPFPEVVAKVGDREIKFEDFARNLISKDGKTVLENMIKEKLLEIAIDKENIKVSKKEIEKKLDEIKKQFKTEEDFKNRLKQIGKKEEEIKNIIVSQLKKDKFFKNKIKVNSKEIKEYFEENKDKLGTPEMVHLKHILVSDEKEAKDLLLAIQAGADFSTLAKVKSLDNATKNRGGDLGFLPKGILIPDIENVAFNMKKGEVKLVKTELGFHIIKLVDKKKKKEAEFNKDVKKRIKNIIFEQKKSKYIKKLIVDLGKKTDIKIFINF